MRYLFITLVATFILLEVVAFTIDSHVVDLANVLGFVIAGWIAIKLDNKEIK